jgi:hypothetical protein
MPCDSSCVSAGWLCRAELHPPAGPFTRSLCRFRGWLRWLLLLAGFRLWHQTLA